MRDLQTWPKSVLVMTEVLGGRGSWEGLSETGIYLKSTVWKLHVLLSFFKKTIKPEEILQTQELFLKTLILYPTMNFMTR